MHVSWMLEIEIQAGQGDAFAALAREMTAATRTNEPGTLNYEWNLSADGRRCHIYERYADSNAVLTHVRTFGDKFAGRFLACARPVRFDVYGAPGEDVKAALADFHPTYFREVAGFDRR